MGFSFGILALKIGHKHLIKDLVLLLGKFIKTINISDYMCIPQYLGRSLSTGLGPDSDRGYESYRTGTCSVHGTLKRHISSGIDTTMEEDMFCDEIDYSDKGPAFPFPTASVGARARSRYIFYDLFIFCI